MHIATLDELEHRLMPALEALTETLEGKARAFEDVVMIGRTHLMDATPVTLGQIITGWVGQLEDAGANLACGREQLFPLALGGTAVGTGLNAHPRFGDLVARTIARETDEPFVSGRNKFALMSAHDAIVNVSAGLRTLAAALMKIANDVRWHASGPRAGLAEILIPDNEPGSSIMPGKVNPTQAEALTMVCVRVFGNDAAVALGGSQGNFQLNVYKPVMLQGVLESIALLADAMRSFDERCAKGIEPLRDRIRENVDRSLMLVTALNPHIGYENAAKIAQTAHREGTSLREAALKLKLVSAEDFDRWVRPEAMTRPGNG
jgi:fumarate hydratase class II